MSRYVVQLLLIFCISCKTEQSEVVFSGDFPGGRLNEVVKEGESYRVSIEPAHEPVNESPYFAFSVVSSNQGRSGSYWIIAIINIAIFLK